ncbi:M1 family metallopeptidase [Sphingomonas faeni]|uniref:M1 family metallopeptidase n=1 Tax=Sphingomonas faeni TaxID=185950 RepID=UPI0020C75CCB|nr:M1 family metallopeptidase [Sphingomonas faeni]MCP8890977.1 M1 family metallopeptidase [Sphingomonas faeni]
MRTSFVIGFTALLLSTTAQASPAPAPAPAQGPSQQGAPTKAAITPDANAPKGRLSDAAVPKAYRLDFTILPEKDSFSGHDEIDVTLKAPTKSLYIHGRDLKIAKAVAMVGGKATPAVFTQVDQSGTARLDFAQTLPAGAATLAFDYTGSFGDSASGVFHVKVGDAWYSWTQFESIDARAAFPSFDEPGFKTPFTVSVTTHPGMVAVSNAPQLAVTKVAGGMEKHQFAPTKPLPTYLVAFDTGPFVHQTGMIPPTPERPTPMPYGAVATTAQKDKMGYVMAETPRIVLLLEKYFGEPFPFPKLDQIGTPIMAGAMENAGADTYGDGIIYLAPGATTREKQSFGMIVAHELSHQWFGDLVTPAWWDDIWLNESFANWMGYRIGNEWRPELNIGVGALAEGFGTMNTDALEVGRPIHQPITENGQIDSAFDNITYGKGGQVVAMIAAYLGDEKFKEGVRLHLKRHAYGNATSEQFFESISDAAKDPRVLAALKSFVDQQGVPVVDVRRQGNGLVATQSRYAFLGSSPPPLSWTIPFCVRVGAAKQCALLDKPATTIAAPASGVIMPNVGGAGYYRFDLAPADWQSLIAASGTLSPGEALATTDSLWAAFRAGKAPAAWLFAEARAVAANPDATASIDGGRRIAGLRARGLITQASLPGYRALLASIYTPRLAALGFDPAAGAHAKDDPDRQSLRHDLVDLVADEARDTAVRNTLKVAGEKYLAGDATALDPGFIGSALTVVAQEGGLPVVKTLIDKALSSEDPTFRQNAIGAAASSGRAEAATYLLGLDDKRMRSYDKIALIFGIVGNADTRDLGTDWILANYETLLAGGTGIFLTSRLPQALGTQCGADQADRIDAKVGALIRKADVGVLTYDRTLESMRHCGVLRQAKSAEIAAALAVK